MVRQLAGRLAKSTSTATTTSHQQECDCAMTAMAQRDWTNRMRQADSIGGGEGGEEGWMRRRDWKLRKLRAVALERDGDGL
jgi:hypothetical protein